MIDVTKFFSIVYLIWKSVLMQMLLTERKSSTNFQVFTKTICTTKTINGNCCNLSYSAKLSIRPLTGPETKMWIFTIILLMLGLNNAACFTLSFSFSNYSDVSAIWIHILPTCGFWREGVLCGHTFARSDCLFWNMFSPSSKNVPKLVYFVAAVTVHMSTSCLLAIFCKLKKSFFQL